MSSSYKRTMKEDRGRRKSSSNRNRNRNNSKNSNNSNNSKNRMINSSINRNSSRVFRYKKLLKPLNKIKYKRSVMKSSSNRYHRSKR